MQVLDGLESYIATEEFLHKLQQASAEWIDLSEQQQQQHAPKLTADGLEFAKVRAAACSAISSGAAAYDCAALRFLNVMLSFAASTVVVIVCCFTCKLSYE